MRDEFDDELDRTQTGKGRSRARKIENGSAVGKSSVKRASQSEPDPYEEDYYLDDDYENPMYDEYNGNLDIPVQNRGTSRRKTSGRKPSGSKTAADSSAATSSASVGTASRSAATGSATRTAAAGSATARRRSAAEERQPTARSRARNADNVRNADNTRNSDIARTGRRETALRSNSRSEAMNAKGRKTKRFIVMAVAEVFTLAFIFAYAYVAKINATVQRPEVNEKAIKNDNINPEVREHMTGYRTIAIFGVDSRDGNVGKGTNADVIMLCNINRETGEIKLVSVYRDTYLNTNTNGTYNKINSAYSTGGPEQALAAINRNLDLDIEEFITFNWKAVADGINMVNGIDIEITKREFAYINSFITETVEKTGVPSVHLKSAGMQHLDGVQAVAYGRLRLMDDDFARTQRQRLVIEKAFEKVKKTDLAKLNAMVMLELEQVGTNLTLGDFTELLLDMNKYHMGESSGFPFSQKPVVLVGKGDCVIPQTLESNVVELHKFLYGSEEHKASDTVKKISAKIAADSGMYKKVTGTGKGTDEDIVKETTVSDKDETKETKEYESGSKVTFEETDEYGNPIETGTDGEYGGPGTTKPGETRPGETKPGETKPGETRPGETRPGESRPGETKPGETRPGESKPGETKPGGIYPGGMTEPTDDTGNTGPGVSPTRAPEESSSAIEPTAPTTAPAGPGSSPETTSAHSGTSGVQPGSVVQPGTTAADDIPVVAAPGAA